QQVLGEVVPRVHHVPAQPSCRSLVPCREIPVVPGLHRLPCLLPRLAATLALQLAGLLAGALLLHPLLAFLLGLPARRGGPALPGDGFVGNLVGRLSRTRLVSLEHWLPSILDGCTTSLPISLPIPRQRRSEVARTYPARRDTVVTPMPVEWMQAIRTDEGDRRHDGNHAADERDISGQG